MICIEVQAKIHPPAAQPLPFYRHERFNFPHAIKSLGFLALPQVRGGCSAPRDAHCYDRLMAHLTFSLLASVLSLLAALLIAPAPAYAGNPLHGTIWDAEAARPVSAETLIERAVQARYLLLGEVHDHAEHHRIQLRLLDALLHAGRRPALVMEQYDLDQQTRIGAIRTEDLPLGQQLDALRRLMREGWEWRDYAPLIERALQYRLPLVAANLPRAELRKRASGADATAALDARWGEAREAELARKIEAGHCGKLPPHVIGMVVRAQRLRDAAMAQAIVAQHAHGAVAILGSGHARRDLAVPLYFESDQVLAIGMVEVVEGDDAHSLAVGALGPRFDYLWFTPAVQRASDPCDSIPAPAITNKPQARQEQR